MFALIETICRMADVMNSDNVAIFMNSYGSDRLMAEITTENGHLAVFIQYADGQWVISSVARRVWL